MLLVVLIGLSLYHDKSEYGTEFSRRFNKLNVVSIYYLK